MTTTPARRCRASRIRRVPGQGCIAHWRRPKARCWLPLPASSRARSQPSWLTPAGPRLGGGGVRATGACCAESTPESTPAGERSDPHTPLIRRPVGVNPWLGGPGGR
eukprot:scaffold8036_cov128-Isochrysis_galbana.AAC.9